MTERLDDAAVARWVLEKALLHAGMKPGNGHPHWRFSFLDMDRGHWLITCVGANGRQMEAMEKALGTLGLDTVEWPEAHQVRVTRNPVPHLVALATLESETRRPDFPRSPDAERFANALRYAAKLPPRPFRIASSDAGMEAARFVLSRVIAQGGTPEIDEVIVRRLRPSEGIGLRVDLPLYTPRVAENLAKALRIYGFDATHEAARHEIRILGHQVGRMFDRMAMDRDGKSFDESASEIEALSQEFDRLHTPLDPEIETLQDERKDRLDWVNHLRARSGAKIASRRA